MKSIFETPSCLHLPEFVDLRYLQANLENFQPHLFTLPVIPCIQTIAGWIWPFCSRHTIVSIVLLSWASRKGPQWAVTKSNEDRSLSAVVISTIFSRFSTLNWQPPQEIKQLTYYRADNTIILALVKVRRCVLECPLGVALRQRHVKSFLAVHIYDWLCFLSSFFCKRYHSISNFVQKNVFSRKQRWHGSCVKRHYFHVFTEDCRENLLYYCNSNSRPGLTSLRYRICFIFLCVRL